MESKKHQISVKRTAQYYVLGNLAEAKTIWLVLHGYGYAAEFFVKKFNAIVNENTCVIAPEALSKFYVNGLDGKVGASWMTKENREEEIDDYLFYLNTLYSEIVSLRKNKPFKLNVLGFSQGGATAARWVAQTTAKPDNFIMWASVFPDDMPFEILKNNNIKSYFLYGDKDVFLTKSRVDLQKQKLQDAGLDIKLIPFFGKHDIPEAVLLEQVEEFGW